MTAMTKGDILKRVSNTVTQQFEENVN